MSLSATAINQTSLNEEQIITTFKSEYQEFLNRHEIPVFEFLIQAVEDIFDIKMTPYLKDKLFFWFENVAEARFLLKFIEMVEFNEVIFHSASKIQVDAGSELDCYTHEGLNSDDYQIALETLALKNHIAWNYTHPFVSFSIKLGAIRFRATLTHMALSPFQVSKLFLRKSHQSKAHLSDFALSDESVRQIQQMVLSKKNILVSGATGSGKTTFVRALLAEIPESEHLVVLEDPHEIPALHDGYTHLLANPSAGADLKSFCA